MPCDPSRRDGRIARAPRQRLAAEAARLMATRGIHDYRQARQKAATLLGIHDRTALPDDCEIERALTEYRRLFSGPQHARDLRRCREAALHALDFFRGFSPRLAGPVLEGTASADSPVLVHVHSDDPDAVARFLGDNHVPAELRNCRVRLDRGHASVLPLWCFSAEGLDFEVLVLPLNALRQAPVSAADGKPMQRASLAQLHQLLETPEIAPPP